MKLPFTPEVTGYNVREGEYRSAAGPLRTPFPEMGRGIPRTAWLVTCKFNLVAAELQALGDFFWNHSAGQIFQMDLVIDGPDMKEYDCRWDVNSWGISNEGLAYYVETTVLALERDK